MNVTSVTAIIVTIINSWILLFAGTMIQIALSETKPAKKAKKFIRKIFLKSWKYISSLLITLSAIFLILHLIKTEPITKFSVFFISFLTSMILLQSVIIYILHLKEKLLEKIENAKTEAEFRSFFHSLINR